MKYTNGTLSTFCFHYNLSWTRSSDASCSVRMLRFSNQLVRHH